MDKNTVYALAAASILLFLASSAHAAPDCNPLDPWSTIPNYKQSMGAACQALGLHSKHGTCQPGQLYETLCDDRAGGQYKLCTGTTPCINPTAPTQNCGNWDFNYNQPCPQGYVNLDCKGGCEQAGGNNPCQNWDYNYNQPCPQGFVNLDCKGGCEPMLRP